MDITLDRARTWQEVEMVESMDADNGWDFWKGILIFPGILRGKLNLEEVSKAYTIRSWKHRK